MNKRQKVFVVLLTPFVLGFLIGFLAGGGCSRRERPVRETVVRQPAPQPEAPEEAEGPDANDDVDGTGESRAREIIYYTRPLGYAKLFNDLNEAHLEKARAVGLRKIPERRDEIDARALVRIADGEHFIVEELRYSVPYLMPGAAAELRRIAQAFHDSLSRKGFPRYKLVVSSVLRTEEDVARLRKSGNPNASDNSAHCYGTTFDITYTNYWRDEETEEFMQPYELTKVLGEVLRDEKAAGRVLVKYERKEHCFHITACTEK